MDSFTLITGLASLFGFAIQVFDLFPRFGRSRQTVFLLLTGVFIGSFLRAIDPSSIHISFQLTGFTVLVGLFAFVITGLLFTATFTSDHTRRNELYGVSGIGFLAFMFVITFGGLFSGTIDSPAAEKQKITNMELNTLTDRAIANKDYERALMHLKTIETRLRGDVERQKLIQEKIREIELREIK